MGGNCHPAGACIHSNLDTFCLDPGTTARLDGRLFIHPQGKEAVLDLAHAFWAPDGRGLERSG